MHKINRCSDDRLAFVIDSAPDDIDDDGRLAKGLLCRRFRLISCRDGAASWSGRQKQT